MFVVVPGEREEEERSDEDVKGEWDEEDVGRDEEAPGEEDDELDVVREVLVDAPEDMAQRDRRGGEIKVGVE